MTFPSILPHLAAGRRVRRAYWLPGHVMGGGNEHLTEVADLLSSDWELVEEPDPSIPRCGGCFDRDATITRLTRELDTERRACGELGASNLRLIRELAETKTELAEANARSVCMSGWGCILSRGHAGQCHDLEGLHWGTPGVDTK